VINQLFPMTRPTSNTLNDSPLKASHPPYPERGENGVVLIIALILLVVISLLAVTSMRSAGSSENIASNVRTTELATQAAEIALRHCESSAIKVVKVLGGDTTSAEATYSDQGLTTSKILWATTSVQWQSTATWDSTSTATYVLPASMVGGTSTYQRPPECMVESLTGVTPVSTGAAFVITARGFGPEVAAADNARTRPQGTEIWLQSSIEIQ
jgi:Tfp pilus assembly protein PilX